MVIVIAPLARILYPVGFRWRQHERRDAGALDQPPYLGGSGEKAPTDAALSSPLEDRA